MFTRESDGAGGSSSPSPPTQHQLLGVSCRVIPIMTSHCTSKPGDDFRLWSKEGIFSSLGIPEKLIRFCQSTLGLPVAIVVVAMQSDLVAAASVLTP